MASGTDIAVIGAGAAGLAAGIFAGQSIRQGGRVVLLDGAERIGAKILVSGGSRCNVTHDHIEPADFFGPVHVVRQVLAAFDQAATVAWFESLGVKLSEETGKLFPISDSAHTVLDALVNRCTELGVNILGDHRVHAVERSGDDGFIITHERGTLTARRVIMATGGRSLPKTGSDGEGYRIVRALGHSVSETYPALVPVVLNGSFFHAKLSGLSVPATLSTFVQNKLVDRRTGSLLFTHLGVSGPVVMDASRFCCIAQGQGKTPVLRCAFLSEDFTTVERWLIDAAATQPKRTTAAALSQRLPGRLAQALAEFVGISPATTLGHLAREQRRTLIHALTGLELPGARERGWNYAEVTAGGVPLSEVDHHTMESRIAPGIYLIGEMLDVDGRIGGFNFQWAWSTGHIAGCAAAESL